MLISLSPEKLNKLRVNLSSTDIFNDLLVMYKKLKGIQILKLALLWYILMVFITKGIDVTVFNSL